MAATTPTTYNRAAYNRPNMTTPIRSNRRPIATKKQADIIQDLIKDLEKLATVTTDAAFALYLRKVSGEFKELKTAILTNL